MDHPAVQWRHDEAFLREDPGETLMAVGQDGEATPVMYYEGAHHLARDLGFMNTPALKGWAERHPDLWGCRHGERMFAGDGAVAFGKAPFALIRVAEIVDWWLAVADRLDAAIPVYRDRADARAELARRDPLGPAGHRDRALREWVAPGAPAVFRQPVAARRQMTLDSAALVARPPCGKPRRSRPAVLPASTPRVDLRRRVRTQPGVAPPVAGGVFPVPTTPLASTSICFFRVASSLGLSHSDVSSRR